MIDVPRFQAQTPQAVHTQQMATSRSNSLGFMGGAMQGLQMGQGLMQMLGKDPASLANKARMEQSKQAAWDNFISRGTEMGLEGRKAYAEAGKILHPDWSEAIDAIDWDNLKDDDIAQRGMNDIVAQTAGAQVNESPPYLEGQAPAPEAAPEDADHPWVTGQPEEPTVPGPEMPLGATGSQEIPPGPTEDLGWEAPAGDPMAGGPGIPFGGDPTQQPPMGPEEEKQVAEALPDAARWMEEQRGLPPGTVQQTKDGQLVQDISTYKEGDVPGQFLVIPPKKPGDEVIQAAVAQAMPSVKTQLLPAVQDLARYNMLRQMRDGEDVAMKDTFIARMTEAEAADLQEEAHAKLGVGQNWGLDHAFALAAMFDPESRAATSKDGLARKLIQEYNNLPPTAQTQVLEMAKSVTDVGFKLEQMRGLNDVRKLNAQAQGDRAEAARLEQERKDKLLPSEIDKLQAEVAKERATADLKFWEAAGKEAEFQNMPETMAAGLAKTKAETKKLLSDDRLNAEKFRELEAKRNRAPIQSVLDQQKLAQDVVDGLQKQIDNIEEQKTKLIQMASGDPVRIAISQGLQKAGTLTPEQKAEYNQLKTRIDSLDKMITDKESGLQPRVTEAARRAEVLGNIWDTYTADEKFKFVASDLAPKLFDLDKQYSKDQLIQALMKKYGFDQNTAARAYKQAGGTQ